MKKVLGERYENLIFQLIICVVALLMSIMGWIKLGQEGSIMLIAVLICSGIIIWTIVVYILYPANIVIFENDQITVFERRNRPVIFKASDIADTSVNRWGRGVAFSTMTFTLKNGR